MLGGYTVVVATNNGVNLWFAMLILAPLVVGLIGLIVERCLIQWLYGRMIDTLLATWGLSLLFIGIITSIFGASTSTVISPPLGTVTIGEYTSSGYELFLILVVIVLLALVYMTLKFTSLGLVARATMQNSDMSACLGISTSKIYMVTFSLGAAVSGLAGGLLVPITGVLPNIGVIYIAKAFITVISGGSAILAGTTSASVLLGGVNGIMSYITGPTFGEVALLFTAIILLRLMPTGITGRFFRKEPIMRLYGTFNGTLVIAGLAIIFTLIAPSIFQFFTIITLTQVIGLSILALSLALVWGFGGILCFGQSAFFGIGAYAYSVAAVNIGGSTGSIFIAILAAAIFAAILGYFCILRQSVRCLPCSDYINCLTYLIFFNAAHLRSRI